ncbi:hypothetical protein RJ639_046605 [Escallonia herrerae]|uniref:Retrotransposon gag domain-containing protein n=1 Tax=Escallonia herrerae TaxID=1293975 RepID=A0AA88W4W6_9ASTE|nr:hypothetical protein RJ639_046605 [Escallonia herrerae]
MAGKDASVGASGVAEENVVVERGRDPLPPIGGKKGGRGQSKSRDIIVSLDERTCVLEETMGNVKDRLGYVEQNLQTFEDHVLEELELLKKAVMGQDELRTRFMELFANLQEQLDVVKVGVEETRQETAMCKRAIAGGAVVTHSPRVDAPKPKEFGGKRDAKELDNFIWHMERYFEGASITDEKAKVRTATLYLTDTATLWWRRKHNDIEKGLCTIDTWDVFKKEIKRQFYPENVTYEARKELRELKHKSRKGKSSHLLRTGPRREIPDLMLGMKKTPWSCLGYGIPCCQKLVIRLCFYQRLKKYGKPHNRPILRCIEIKCSDDAAMLKNFIEKDGTYDFLAGLNIEFDQVRIQILGKEELPLLNETISIINAEERQRGVMLYAQPVKVSTMLGKIIDKNQKFNAEKTSASHTVNSEAGRMESRPLSKDKMWCTYYEKEALRKYLAKEFEIKDLRKLKYFLGIEVAWSKEGIFVSQQIYVLDLLEETGKLDCRPSDMPIEPNYRLAEFMEGEPTDKGMYQQLVGKLIYLSHTRPDIAYAVSVVSQFMRKPKDVHLHAVYQILQYLKGS